MQRATKIDPHSATPDWGGERLDVDWAMTMLHPATVDPLHRDVPAETRSTPDRTDLSPGHNYGHAPRVARRPAGQARRGSKLGDV